ncbi:MAG: BCCT family transporter, partial [Pseudomonadota bacterium]|nr:BCCT family transporter [Pseudomonadota bacterium]
LRQLIVGMVGFGTLGCAVFYVVVGNTAMWMDMAGLVDVRTLINQGQNGTAIAQIMAALPLHPLPLIAFIVMAWIFVATTYDSASYAIASSATRDLSDGLNPAQWHRVFWAFALAVLPITLMILDDLRAVKSAVLVVSLPLLAIGVIMTISLFRTLKANAEH